MFNKMLLVFAPPLVVALLLSVPFTSRTRWQRLTSSHVNLGCVWVFTCTQPRSKSPSTH